ncbi:uncharacterized protein BDZ99DRAFT_172463 [Mytilinidion resinicola]|uniref:Uncharacterized protein n=1 Tax=Mytilinidion resinicola TaxID=574789 RepID=A0A6A6Y432_9PEZI|nr:uncharacterized protein BDZ99DRAFT_172463 [Mytilinidion resinicola]KAF2803410.1 hypothetical protein BDZ99DRAFT_172463 [Mytilinidion resinicola]
MSSANVSQHQELERRGRHLPAQISEIRRNTKINESHLTEQEADRDPRFAIFISRELSIRRHVQESRSVIRLVRRRTEYGSFRYMRTWLKDHPNFLVLAKIHQSLANFHVTEMIDLRAQLTHILEIGIPLMTEGEVLENLQLAKRMLSYLKPVVQIKSRNPKKPDRHPSNTNYSKDSTTVLDLSPQRAKDGKLVSGMEMASFRTLSSSQKGERERDVDIRLKKFLSK